MLVCSYTFRGFELLYQWCVSVNGSTRSWCGVLFCFSCRVGDHGYVEDLCFPRCLRPGHLPDVLLTSRACQVRHTEIVTVKLLFLCNSTEVPQTTSRKDGQGLCKNSILELGLCRFNFYFYFLLKHKMFLLNRRNRGKYESCIVTP